jgi:hypothetical protein
MDRVSTDYSITVRTEAHAKTLATFEHLLKWLDTNASHYVLATEQKEGPDSRHYQCAARLTTPRRADHLKTTLLGILRGDDWTVDNERCAIVVKRHPDIVCLAGGYCHKQDTTPHVKGWSNEELEEGLNKYSNMLEAKEKRNPSIDKIVAILRGFHDYCADVKDPEHREAYSKLSNSAKVDFLFKFAITKGYFLVKFNTLQWKLYFKDNFNQLFETTGNEITDEKNLFASIIKHAAPPAPPPEYKGQEDPPPWQKKWAT